MQLPALNVNVIIIAILLAMGLYGLIAGKQRLRILILSIYVGIVIAEQMSAIVAPYLKMLGADQISWLLLGLPIVIFGFIGIVHGKHHNKGSAIANSIVGLLAGALIISSALHLMPISEMAAVDNDSFLATNLQQFHLWILGLLPVVALLLGFMKSEKGGH
jgi:hypothetical protein